MAATKLTARLVPSIAAVDAAGWDACANPSGLSEDAAEGERFNPFVAHAFLHALEASGSRAMPLLRPTLSSTRVSGNTLDVAAMGLNRIGTPRSSVMGSS